MSQIGFSVELPAVKILASGTQTIKNWIIDPAKGEFNTGSFDPEKGIFTVDKAGQFAFSSGLKFTSPISPQDETLPNLVILVNDNIVRTVEPVIPTTGELINEELVIDTSLNLSAGDKVSIAIQNVPNPLFNGIPNTNQQTNTNQLTTVHAQTVPNARDAADAILLACLLCSIL